MVETQCWDLTHKTRQHQWIAAWCSGWCVGCDQRSCSTPGPITTWMGDCLWTGKPSRYVTSYLGQLSLPSLQGRWIEYRPVWLGLRQGAFKCVGWNVTLCDPIWQVTVTPRSSETGSHEELHTALTCPQVTHRNIFCVIICYGYARST